MLCMRACVSVCLSMFMYLCMSDDVCSSRSVFMSVYELVSMYVCVPSVDVCMHVCICMCVSVYECMSVCVGLCQVYVSVGTVCVYVCTTSLSPKAGATYAT